MSRAVQSSLHLSGAMHALWATLLCSSEQLQSALAVSKILGIIVLIIIGIIISVVSIISVISIIIVIIVVFVVIISTTGSNGLHFHIVMNEIHRLLSSTFLLFVLAYLLSPERNTW